MHLSSVLIGAGIGAVAASCLWMAALLRAMDLITDAEHRAAHDPLTGLAHRDTVRGEYRRRRAEGRLSTMLLIDLDRFKAINDSLGHHAADQILIDVSAVLEDFAEDLDGFAARVSGDEFVVLIPAQIPEVHVAQVRKLRELISEPVTVDAHHGEVTLCVSGTVGVAVGDHGLAGADWSVLIRAADLALYHAKRARLPFQLHHPELVVPPQFDELRLRDLPSAESGGL